MRSAIVIVLLATPLFAGCNVDAMPFSLRLKRPHVDRTVQMAHEHARCDGAPASQ